MKPSTSRTTLRMASRTLSAALLLGCFACKPDLGDPVSLIKEPTLLAVRSEPPEATPGATVHLSALVATPAGTLRDGTLTWSDCLTPKPPVENNFVSSACVTQPDDPGKVGDELDDEVPAQACTFFGPVAPPVQPPVRGRDPDGTGGFFFPVRVAARGKAADGGDLLAFGAVRLARSCGLPYAAPLERQTFTASYGLNLNPVATALTASWPGAEPMVWASLQTGDDVAQGGEDDRAGELPTVPAGATVTLQQSWTTDSAESYPLYDVATTQLVDQRESLSVAWFTTAGVLLHDRTGRAADESETFAENIWTAPAVARSGPIFLWSVLRDSRGGVAYASYAVRVAAR